MCQTFFKSHCLNIQDLITTAFSFFFYARYKWSGIKFAGKFCFFSFKSKQSFIITDILSFRSKIRCKLTGCHSPSFIIQTMNIKIRIDDAIHKPSALSENRPILGNQILSTVNHILRGLALPCRRINISTEKSRRLSTHKTPPVRIFANNFIACRQIDDQIRTMICMCNTRWIRYPEILTDFGCNLKLRHLLTGKDHIRRNPDIFLIQFSILFLIIFVYIIRLFILFKFFKFFKAIKFRHLNLKFHIIGFCI